MNYDEQIQYEKARKRVKDRQSFKSHFVVFLVTMAFLAGVNYFSSPSYWWVIWPMMAWGVGLVFHYLSAHKIIGINEEKEQREIEREMRKMNAEQDSLELPPIEDQELDMKEFKELRREWKDDEFV